MYTLKDRINNRDRLVQMHDRNFVDFASYVNLHGELILTDKWEYNNVQNIKQSFYCKGYICVIGYKDNEIHSTGIECYTYFMDARIKKHLTNAI
jgi:hypothetical protein